VEDNKIMRKFSKYIFAIGALIAFILGGIFAVYQISASGHEETAMLCEPFPEPVIGQISVPSTELYPGHDYFEYLQVGARHFQLVKFLDDDMMFFTTGSLARAIEVDGMIASVGMEYGNSGWVFAREMNPLWEITSMHLYTDEWFEEYRQALDAFITEHGEMISVNVYDFDGLTIVDTWHQPISSHVVYFP